MNDNLFNCDLKQFECPPLPTPDRPDQFGVISWWPIRKWWTMPKDWGNENWAQLTAKRRANDGHTHISIVRIPGAQKP